MKTVTSAEMKRLDQRASEEFGIPPLLLMENAGRGVADLACEELAGKNLAVIIVCGKGNNGGDGFVAARHLANRGYPVEVVLLADPGRLKEDPALNFNILQKMKVPAEIFPHSGGIPKLAAQLQRADFVIDALLGIGLDKPLAEPFLSAVQAVNDSGKKILAVDLPSGLNADTGEVMGAAVRAARTATLCLAKSGLFAGKGPEYAGKVSVVDIGIPLRLIEEIPG